MAGSSLKNQGRIVSVGQSQMGLVAGTNISFLADASGIKKQGRLTILQVAFKANAAISAGSKVFYIPESYSGAGQIYASFVSTTGAAVNIYKTELDSTKGRSFSNRSALTSGASYIGVFVYFSDNE